MESVRAMFEIFVGCDGNWSAPEVEISGSSTAMAAFGRFLSGIADSCFLDIPISRGSFYPVSLPTIALDLAQDETGRLTVSVDNKALTLSGSSDAFEKLGRSLQNFFDDDTKIGEHFHFDYYEGNPNLNETSCNLVFLCARRSGDHSV
jgi:hypothetical protein